MRAHDRCSAVVRSVTLSFALLASHALAWSQGFDRISVPIPIEIDGRPVPCPVYLNLESKSYNLPFDAFAARRHDKAQAMFATAVYAIREGNAAKFASVWTPPNEMQARSTTSVSMVPNSAENWLSAARSAFRFNELVVIAQLQAGPDTLFVWESAMKGGTRRRSAFYVGPDKTGQTRLSAVSSANPVQSLVLSAYEAARTDPDGYGPKSNIHLRYRYPIPLAGKADPGEHPVYLEFDGSPMNFSVTDQKVAPPTPLLDFFRKATLAQRRGDDEAYAGSFTPRSQKKVREWLASMQTRSKQTGSPPQPVASAVNVKFVLDADPVYLVFTSATSRDDWTSGNLSHTFVLHKDGVFQMTNFFYLGDFEDLLQNPALFDSQFLKTAPSRP
jgi:hypothetical protein